MVTLLTVELSRMCIRRTVADHALAAVCKMIWKPLFNYPGYRISDTGRIQCRRKRGSHGGLQKHWREVFYSLNVDGYAVNTFRNDGHSGTKKQWRIHQLVWLSFVGPIPKGLVLDHIDENRLNNRLDNLRLVTNSQNIIRVGKTRGNNKYKGVWKQSKSATYRSAIMYQGKRLWLGSFKTEKEAALAYNAKAKELFGNLAYLNGVH